MLRNERAKYRPGARVIDTRNGFKGEITSTYTGGVNVRFATNFETPYPWYTISAGHLALREEPKS